MLPNNFQGQTLKQMRNYFLVDICRLFNIFITFAARKRHFFFGFISHKAQKVISGEVRQQGVTIISY